jgi:hypothetical protein
MDFRLDFPALCLFGAFGCALACSELLARRGWALAAGAVGAWCVLARYPAALYVSGVWAMLFAVVCLRWLFQSRASRAGNGARVLNCALGGSLCLFLILPAIYLNRHGIYNHYIAHVERSENQVRFEEFGVYTTKDWLLYYPRSVVNDHVGEKSYQLAGVVVGVAGLLGLVFWAFSPALAPPATLAWRGALFCSALCTVWPILVLTAYPSPSPIVANVVVAPLVLCVCLAAVVLSGSLRPDFPGLGRYGLLALSGLALGAGLFTQADKLSSRGPLARQRESVEQVTGLYDLVYQQSRANRWTAPVVFIDYLADFLNYHLIKPFVYERHGALLQPRVRLPVDPMFECDEKTALAHLQASDLVILTTGELPFAQEAYPFNRSLAKVRPSLIAYCEREMVRLRSFRYCLGEVTVYARPALSIKGGEPDGWFGTAATLEGPTELLRKWPVVELRGPNGGARFLGGLPAVDAELVLPGERPRPVRATLTGDPAEYRLLLQVPPDLPPQQTATIRLSFRSYFVPKQVGVSEDRRKLVMQLPSAQVFHRGPEVTLRP